MTAIDTSSQPHRPNRRILIVDDNAAIHADFRKVLSGPTLAERAAAADLAETEAALFGDESASAMLDQPTTTDPGFELSFASQGQEAVEATAAALARGTPFAMAFVDMRMPPGWDGLETIRHLWEVDPRLEVVICSAYSDYTWTDIVAELGPTDRLLVLKKPFDSVEARQLGLALTVKWDVTRAAEAFRTDLEKRVEARTSELRAEIARRAAIEVELRAARDAADGANRAKSEFLANMSHEIRTPLNGIIGMIDLLANSQAEPGHRRYADVAKGSARLLLSIINDILDFSKVEAGRLELETIDFNLHSLIEDVADSFAPSADEKGLDLTCLIEQDVPIWANGDPNRLRQVLSNLLGNAVKFTASGHVSVRIASRTNQAGASCITVRISDTGIGIPSDRRDRLFKPFSQAEASTTRRFGGTGLGLAISYRLVKLMGGQIGVESQPGEGSTFWFTALLGPAPEPAGARAQPNLPARVDLDRVLLVGTPQSTTPVLSAQLQLIAGDVRVKQVGDRAAAMDELHNGAGQGRPYRLVIVDSRLADGAALAGEIQASRALAGTSIICVRGIQDQIKAGAAPVKLFDATIQRPVRTSEVREVLAVLFARQAEPVAKSSVKLPPDQPSSSGRRVLIVDDNEINQLVAQSLLATRGYVTDSASNGLEAVEAVMRQEYDLVLMDWSMPVMDGVEAATRIRALEQIAGKSRRRIPIIALTAAAWDEDRVQSLSAGMDAYLPKPIVPAQLFETCERLLSNRPERAVA